MAQASLENPKSLVELFLARVAKSSSQTSQMIKKNGQWTTLTWVEQDRITREVAHALLRLGLEDGERVAIFAGTRSEWIASDIAILSNHAISVPIYPTSTA